MRALFLDCISGISGDMTVGALCDLGVPQEVFEAELRKLDVGPFYAHFDRQHRQNVEGVKFDIHEEAGGHSHPHEHEHGHAHGRSHAEIRTLIERSELSEFVKRRALGIFQRIAIAEGKIHGQTPDDVTFHEVGAFDSIADILCACVGIEHLAVHHIAVSNLFEGRGWIDCAHGRFPIPSAATLEILAGIPLEQIDQPFEFITPTGAAIVAEFGQSFGLMPRMRPEKIGYGIGSRDLSDRPNVLRAVLGELDSTAGYASDTVTQLETNLDDLTPELAGAVMEKLLIAGALDAFITAVQMKKNRPGIQLTVLCTDAKKDSLLDLIFRETTAFGLRISQVNRLKLDRRIETVETPYGPIAVKIGTRAGETMQTSPEFESCRKAAETHNVPIRTVFAAALSRVGVPPAVPGVSPGTSCIQ